MGKEVSFKLKPETALTEDEIAMIEAARSLPAEHDEDNPEIDPVATPEQYAALMQAVARRNQRIARLQRKMG
ncbi:MAG: hypothetical protein IJ769_11125 [Clostridia bacterium]|nr:hypothetical protein [Clostridia bacterium]